jgi:DNA uptake protein ComE-like DNA-binding protein
VGLLWCLALLSVVVIGVLYNSRLDLMAVKNQGDLIQAHYLALAGIEKTKALLYQEALDRRRSAQNHSGELYDAPQLFRDVPFGRGQFRIFRQGRREEGGRLIFGIGDEESRLNVNVASVEELQKLFRLTVDTAAAIIDWRDGDNTVTPGGAEAEYYASLQPPYLPRNGPFETTRELLMVRGLSRTLLLGEDANFNGLLDPEEDDGDESYPADNHDGILDAGWSENLTVHSGVRNLNAAGQDQVNIQTADEAALSAVKGISADLAKAIVAYRNQKKFASLADLLEVTPVSQQRPGGTPPRSNVPGFAPAVQPASGEKLISETLLMDIADDLTAQSGREQAGAVNINTAGAAVLACLPGVSQELAQAMIAQRQSAGFYPNIAHLLKVTGMTREIFKQLAPKVCARSETFRLLSEGKVASTGARKRLEVVLRLGASDFETLAWREDDL